MSSVRISSDSKGERVLVRMDRYGDPPRFRKTEKSVTAIDVEHFLQEIEKTSFWSMTRETDPDKRRKYVFDDGITILEGARGGKYHVVMRHDSELGELNEVTKFLGNHLGRTLPVP